MLQEHLVNQVHERVMSNEHSIMKVNRKVAPQAVEVIEDRNIDC